LAGAVADSQRAMMMDVDQAAKAMRDNETAAEIEDFLEGFNQPICRGMRLNVQRVATWSLLLGPFATDFSFRFYFDGLIVHILRNLNVEFEKIERLMVGFSSTLVVQTQILEHSYQLANIKQHIVEGTLQWSEVISRLTGFPHGGAPQLPPLAR
jgi:hypothetical protein